jgi:NAD(P)-dependent dehydrogenase (short-subunit alcohol dehydrogenase family)
MANVEQEHGHKGMDEMIKNMSPMGRMSNPMEIAWVALYLASDESLFVTGAEMVIDGGAVARLKKKMDRVILCH